MKAALIGSLKAGALIVATFGLVRFCVSSYIITADSMAGTLLSGDVVLVLKTNLAFSQRNGRERVERFDVVAAVSPIGNEVIIKRVTGTPGDTLRSVGGMLYLNGAPLHEPWATPPERLNDWVDWRMSWQRQYLVHRADAKDYRPTRDDWGPLLIPRGHYLLLGDNRAGSVDSRQLGLVEEQDLLGRAVMLLGSYESGSRSRDRQGHIRWNRVFRKVR